MSDDSLLGMIQALCNPELMAEIQDQIPPVYTPVISALFPQTVEHPTAAIGLAEHELIITPAPVARRQDPPVALRDGNAGVSFIAPRPIRLSLNILASELQDMRTLGTKGANLQDYLALKVGLMKKITLATADAMASVVATTGKLTWPSQLEGGGREIYELKFGELRQFDPDPALAWDSSTLPSLSQVYQHLQALEGQVQENGGGGNVKFLAGQNAFLALLNMAEQRNTERGIAVHCADDGTVNIAGYEIKGLKERYQSPQDGAWLYKIPEDLLLGYSFDQPGSIYYLPADSIAHIESPPTWFDVVAEPFADGAGVALISNCRPVPVRNLKSLIRSQVTGLA